MPTSKQHALADDLLSIVSGHVAKIPDDRPNHCSSKISLHDAVMSALAVMHLKYPSLLEFDEAKLKPEIAHNIRSLYNVKQIPCDTYMRELVDPVKPADLRKIFTKLFAVVQRSNRLKHFKYLDEGYLAAIDGTGHFSSGTIHCNECCCKHPKGKGPQYYHQLLAMCLVKPGMKEVLPLMPEPIIQQIDVSKNDCEKNALKRLLEHVRCEHPHLKLVLGLDGLYSDGPTITLIRSYGHNFIAVAREGDHQALMNTVDELDTQDQVSRHQFTDEKGFSHWFRFVNDVPINKSNPDVLVNYLEYVETSPKGKKFSCTWVTSIELTTTSVTKVMRGGRARWKIENETFNTLKTQGYNLEHNYGHGKQHLATNLAILMLLAFLIDQVEQLACPIFRAAWHHKRSKISLWLTIKSLFDWFLIDCWHSLLLAITQGGGQGQSIRSLIPDTS